MKVGFVTTNDIAGPSGFKTRVLAEIEQVMQHGIHVTVISFLHVKYYRNARGISRYAQSIREMGCQVSVVPYAPDNQIPILFSLMDRYQSLWIRQFIKQQDISLLHCADTQAACVGVLATRSTHVPVIYDMHGWGMSEYEERIPNGNAGMRRLGYIEEVAVRGASAVISVSNALQETWLKYYPRTSAVQAVIPCAVDTERFRFLPQERQRLRQLWEVDEDVPVFVYVGQVEAYQKLDETLDLFASMRSRFSRARMIIITPQRDIPIVEYMAAARGITPDTIMCFSVLHEEVPKYLSACDFGFMMRDDLLLNRVASPTKFGEYIACGVPVIASPYIDDLRRAIDQYQIGFIFNGDIQELETFVRRVMRQRTTWKESAEKFARKNFSWKMYGVVLVNLYRRLLESNAKSIE